MLPFATNVDWQAYQVILQMIMRRPDCQLKEYLQEIYNRYEITVSKGRFSDILKDLGITYKKAHFSTLWSNNSSQKKLHSEMKSLEMPRSERLHNGALNKLFFLTNWRQFRFGRTHAWMGTERSHYSISCALPEPCQLQYTSCNDCWWLYCMPSLLWCR